MTIPSRHSSPNLVARVETGEALDVRSFAIDERISTLFEVTLVVMSDSPDVDLDGIVGQPASFELIGLSRGARGSRRWTGICSRFQQIAVEDRGLSTYELTLVPVLWLLTQRRNHRMFQLMSEPEIVQQILGEWGIDTELALGGTYKKRKYRVQYAETDYAFVCRMLEDAGISFFFRQGDSATVMVLSDAPELGERRSAPIAFRDSPTHADFDHATKVRLSQEVRPGRYTIRDHDTRLPPSYTLGASAADVATGTEAKLESFHYVPGAFLFGAEATGGTPTADDRATTRSDEREGASLAKKRLQAARAGRRSCTFETNAVDVAPGLVVSIADHPRADLAGSLLVVGMHHEGNQDGVWIHRATAYPADVPFRPAPTAPKPKVSGVESARVVGPAGEEIHTDEFGRVRVHFHWDRESQSNEKSSCWIHVSQSWGGAGYGGSNLPRIGQEVIVDFLGGDPDRPVIVGRVYTNQQKTPYKLPENKTQSGWKSCSTNQTGGYNEVMFEDASGRELLRMQAEKDLHKLVKHDEEVIIGRDRTKLVKNDDKLTVNRDRSKAIDNDERVVIGNDRSELVKQDEDITIGRDRSELVKQNEDITIGGNRAKTVQQNEREVVLLSRTRLVGVNEAVVVGVAQELMVGVDRTVQIGANQTTSIGSDQSLKVGGAQSSDVGKTSQEKVGLAKMLTVGAAYQIAVGGVMNTTVGGAQIEEVGLTKSVVAGTSITLTCGRSSLVMDAAGKITWAIADGASIVLDDKNITITAASGGSVIVQGGPEVHLNP